MATEDRQAGCIVDTSRSPHARLRPLALAEVSLGDGFWQAWRNMNSKTALSYGYNKLDESGVLRNFEIAAGRKTGSFQNMRFADSDLYKWLEAACFELACSPEAELERKVQEAVDLIGAAQQEDGYVDTYYQLGDIDRRWANITVDHELYCAGHMFQAAVAHHRATGRTDFLNIARRFADHIDSVFGPGKLEKPPGHPEIETALVELYRVTGEKRYLGLAGYLLDRRGHASIGGGAYHQDHVPVREAQELAGHAVRQLYLLAGAADVYLETGESALMTALERLWKDMTRRKMSITGGVGARHQLESFGDSYELPNDRPYNETCAQIASCMWNWRMLLATGEARFADLMEWTLYNSVISGVSLDGTRYFYPNHLLSRGNTERSEWFACACCPPNVMRTLASIGGYMATKTEDGLQLHLYDEACFATVLGQAGEVELKVETRYPWEGVVKVAVSATPEGEWTLSLRVPGWCSRAELAVNEQPSGVNAVPGTYAAIKRRWRKGDVVCLKLDMPAVLYSAHPYVEPARGCATVTRGPLVYCLEGCDQEPGLSVLDCVLDADGNFEPQWRQELLGGVTVLTFSGYVRDYGDWADALYRPRTKAGGNAAAVEQAEAGRAGTMRKTVLTAIPYYAWANREKAPMAVWIPLA